MRLLCEAGIQFGSAELRSHLGSVVRLDLDPLSMAQVARPPHPEAHGHAQAEGHGHAEGTPVSLCGLVSQGATLEVLWGLLQDTAQHHRSAPLAPTLVKQLAANSLSWRPGETAARLSEGSLIVLGGAYDSQDRFATSALAEPVPGALLHASALANPGRDGHHALAWAADVVLGTLLGLVFAALWTWVGHSRLHSSHWQWREVLRSWWVPVRALVPWAVAAAVGYGLMKAAGWLMAHSFWLNPGPMVLGMLLHTLLLKDEEVHPIANWRVYTQHHPAWPLQLTLILAGLAFGPVRPPHVLSLSGSGSGAGPVRHGRAAGGPGPGLPVSRRLRRHPRRQPFGRDHHALPRGAVRAGLPALARGHRSGHGLHAGAGPPGHGTPPRGSGRRPAGGRPG
jgi:hypothetical protein